METSRSALRRLLVGLSCGLLSLTPSALSQKPAQQGSPAEYDVKAAFLLNFTRFVDWPQTPTERAASAFSICILGDDPFGDSLNRIVSGESIKGRPLRVKRIRKWPDACEVLFIPASQPSSKAMLADVGRDVLTVGETPEFLRDGGMIRFLIEGQRVRFDINRQAVESSSLKMSARLLAVARVVR